MNSTIRIHIRDAQQLFDSRDPAPFHERDLDTSFANYLIAYADELNSKKKRFQIEIDIAEPHPFLGEQEITAAVRKYFEYQINLKRIQFSKTMRMARLFFFIGLIALMVCLSLANVLKYIQSEVIKTTFREGVVIFGWVSLWRPFEVFMFDWYPIYSDVRLYKKIFASDIRVVFLKKG